MKYFVALILFSSAALANAQWRKLPADFYAPILPTGTIFHQPVTCIYFLDLPGPPRIGFMGTESSLYKTTNGGQSWFGVWDTGNSSGHFDVTGICFKDSLTGWFSMGYFTG